MRHRRCAHSLAAVACIVGCFVCATRSSQRSSRTRSIEGVAAARGSASRRRDPRPASFRGRCSSRDPYRHARTSHRPGIAAARRRYGWSSLGACAMLRFSCSCSKTSFGCWRRVMHYACRHGARPGFFKRAHRLPRPCPELMPSAVRAGPTARARSRSRCGRACGPRGCSCGSSRSWARSRSRLRE
jgi:hypothetical protein